MPSDFIESQDIERTKEFLPSEGVCFDPDNISLKARYGDELSLYRARRNWSETLESTFLLEGDRDFSFSIERDYNQTIFMLNCEFLTACGRYAFWRLTNNQAPEAQYEIETAHIPDCSARHDDFISAPDMQSLDGYGDSESPKVLEGLNQALENNQGFYQWLQEVIKRIGKGF